MDKFNANTDGHIGEDSFESPTVKTTGDKPKTIHVAHRRSPSELTTLMRMYCINFFFPPLLFSPHFFVPLSNLFSQLNPELITNYYIISHFF